MYVALMALLRGEKFMEDGFNPNENVVNFEKIDIAQNFTKTSQAAMDIGSI